MPAHLIECYELLDLPLLQITRALILARLNKNLGSKGRGVLLSARKRIRSFTRQVMTTVHDRLFPEFSGRQTTLHEYSQRQTDPNSWLTEKIREGRPFCAARFGGDELEVTQQWRRLTTRAVIPRIFDSLAAGDPAFTFFRARQRIQKRGLYPLNASNLDRFAGLMTDSMSEVDLLGSWIPGEAWFQEQMPGARFAPRMLLEPYRHEHPWTLALEGKKVLVVHPFDQSIAQQYEKRTEIFMPKPLLPEFTLMTHRPPRAHFGEIQNADQWFHLMDKLSREVVEKEFDIALIGAGPFGFPLAAAIKRSGRQAVHLGGVLQILFGIRGKRWESEAVSGFFNSAWVSPSAQETPPLKARRMSETSYW